MVPLHHRPHRLLLLHAESSSPPPPRSPPANESGGGGGRGRTSSYSGEADFDANMVIILAALLCALICALGLNSIVRCALRCSRRFTFETPDETAARLAATGLRNSVVSKIPVVIYGAAGLVGNNNNNNNNGIRVIATDCAICLGDFVGGEKVRVLPKCKHGFHVRCIDTWLASHSSCPTCRQSLVDVILHDPHQDDHQPQPPAPSSNAAAEADDTHSGIIRHHHYYQDNHGTMAASSSESQNQTIDVPMPAADEVG